MATRKVFGRRWFEFRNNKYKLELRADGLWVRRYKARFEWRIPLEVVLNWATTQPELFTEYAQVDEGFKKPAVSGVQEGQLVSSQPGDSAVHESAITQIVPDEKRGDGVAAPAEPAAPGVQSAA